MKTTLAVCLLAVLPQLVLAQGAADGPGRRPDGVSPPSGQKEVLVLYVTRRDAEIAIVGDRELPRVLERGLAGGLDYYSEFLDQARIAQPNYLDAFSKFLKVKYQGHQFDLVIAMGDAPLGFVVSHRSVFGNSPVVYFSDRPVNRPPNAAGLVAGVNLSATLDLATSLQPDARTVVVVNGASPRNIAYRDMAQQQFRPYTALTFQYLSGLSISDLESRLAALPDKTIVYYLIVDRDGAGEVLHPLEYIDRVTAVSTAPVYSWVDSAMGRGIVGGSLKSQEAQVRMIGTLALRVLGGESADAIPILSPDLNVTEVDWRQLRRWRIPESRVPPGAVVRFREPLLWDRYRGLFIAAIVAFLAQSALIAGLLLQRAMRRKAEAQVRESQLNLRRSYDRIRDLGARLLNAQENERARIARELHDDVSQQMSLLGIDLEQLNGAVDGNAARLTHEALDRSRQIAKSIHDLSHRLHPARLQLLGLVGALRGLQRELSQPGVTVTFTSDHVPPLAQELTLSLFRIVQEAVQNSIKHGKAHQVTVSLSGVDNRLRLSISDDGIGFDVDRAWGRGLGLISIQERLDAVGGTLSIRSAPGEGTTLDVAVPVVDAAASGRIAV